MNTEQLKDAAVAEITRTRWRFLAAGALLYMAWTIEALVLPGRFEAMTSYVSELSARDQTGSWLFRLTDAAAGICIAIGALAVLRSLGGEPDPGSSPGPRRTHRRRSVRLGWWALVGFGVATLADTVFPMACAPSQSQWCAAQDRAGALGWVHTVHSVTSTTAGLMLVAAVVLLTSALATRRAQGWLPMLVVGVVVLVTSVWSLAESVDQLLDASGYALVGLAQRIQLVATFGWLTGLTWIVREHSRTQG